MRRPLRKRDFTLRQNRVVYILMVATALVALVYALWQHLH